MKIGHKNILVLVLNTIFSKIHKIYTAKICPFPLISQSTETKIIKILGIIELYLNLEKTIPFNLGLKVFEKIKFSRYMQFLIC